QLTTNGMGSFWCSGADTSPGPIYALFPSGGSPSGHTVEAATRSNPFQINGDTWTKVNGLTFRYACNAWHNPMVVCTGSNNLMTSNTVEWANAAGLAAYGSNNTFSNNVVQ